MLELASILGHPHVRGDGLPILVEELERAASSAAPGSPRPVNGLRAGQGRRRHGRRERYRRGDARGSPPRVRMRRRRRRGRRAGARTARDSSAGTALGVAADVSTEEGVERLRGRRVDRFGRIDLLPPERRHRRRAGRRFPTWRPADFDRVLDVNVRGVFLGLRAAFRQFATQEGGGAIVTTASICSFGGGADLVALPREQARDRRADALARPSTAGRSASASTRSRRGSSRPTCSAPRRDHGRPLRHVCAGARSRRCGARARRRGRRAGRLPAQRRRRVRHRRRPLRRRWRGAVNPRSTAGVGPR